MPYVRILFTRYRDVRSGLLYIFGRQKYTHCSIALSETPDVFYSFNLHGFAVESMEKFRSSGVRDFHTCCIEVSEGAYQLIRNRIMDVKEHRSAYSYSKAGVVFSLLHLPYHREGYYFCSEFVQELLDSSGALYLRRRHRAYLPTQLLLEIEIYSEAWNPSTLPDGNTMAITG